MKENYTSAYNKGKEIYSFERSKIENIRVFNKHGSQKTVKEKKKKEIWGSIPKH